MHAFLLPTNSSDPDPGQAAVTINEATRQRFTGVGAIEPLGMALQRHPSSLVIACCGCEVCCPVPINGPYTSLNNSHKPFLSYAC